MSEGEQPDTHEHKEQSGDVELLETLESVFGTGDHGLIPVETPLHVVGVREPKCAGLSQRE